MLILLLLTCLFVSSYLNRMTRPLTFLSDRSATQPFVLLCKRLHYLYPDIKRFLSICFLASVTDLSRYLTPMSRPCQTFIHQSFMTNLLRCRGSMTQFQGWQVWLQSGSDWTPNWTKPGLFQIRFQYIWLDEPNVLKSDLKKSRICPIWSPI